MDKNTDKKFMDEEDKICELIKNYKLFINNELVIKEQLKKFKNKEEMNLLLKVLNDHCNEENIKIAIISGFVKEITGLDNSDLFSKACLSGEFQNLIESFLNDIDLLNTLESKDLINSLIVIPSKIGIDFFKDCIASENIEQMINDGKFNLNSIIQVGYINIYKSSNFENKSKEEQKEEIKNIYTKQKEISQIIFKNEQMIDSINDDEMLCEILINSIVKDDAEIFNKFFAKKNIMEKITNNKKVTTLFQKASRSLEYYEKLLEDENIRLSENKLSTINIHNITIDFVSAILPVSSNSTDGKKRKKEERDAEKNLKESIIRTIFKYEDAKELICKDFLLLCKRLHSEFAVEYLINNDELLNKILENNNNAIEEAFIDSLTNNEGLEVAKVLFNNERTREFIKPETIKTCFENACENNNIKIINLLINNVVDGIIDEKINSDTIKNSFKKAYEKGNLNTIQSLIEYIDNDNKIKIFHDTFLTENNRLSEQDLRLSSIIIEKITDGQQLRIEDNDYETFKNNTNKLIENLFEKNDKDRENKINKIKNDIKKMKKEKNKNNSWKDKNNFEKILLIFYKIEENLVDSNDKKQQDNLTVK